MHRSHWWPEDDVRIIHIPLGDKCKSPTRRSWCIWGTRDAAAFGLDARVNLLWVLFYCHMLLLLFLHLWQTQKQQQWWQQMNIYWLFEFIKLIHGCDSSQFSKDCILLFYCNWGTSFYAMNRAFYNSILLYFMTLKQRICYLFTWNLAFFGRQDFYFLPSRQRLPLAFHDILSWKSWLPIFPLWQLGFFSYDKKIQDPENSR